MANAKKQSPAEVTPETQPEQTNVNPQSEVQESQPETKPFVSAEEKSPEQLANENIAQLLEAVKSAMAESMTALQSGDQSAILAANAKAFTANNAYANAVNAETARVEKLKFETAREAWVEQILNAPAETKAAFDAAKAVYDASAKTPADITIYNTAYDAMKNADQQLHDIIASAYKPNAGGVVHIPMGTTGAKLTKTATAATPANGGENKSAKIKELLNAGLDIDQIMEQTGYERKLITDVRWNWEKATGRR